MKNWFGVLIVLLTLPLLLSAQEIDKVLSLEECIKVALENNIKLELKLN